MRTEPSWLSGVSLVARQALALLLVGGGRLLLAGAVDCDPVHPDVAAVVVAIFNDPLGTCDLNGDGRVTAADATQAQFLLAITPTPIPTPTPRTCPVSGADLVIELDNRTGTSSISIAVDGTRQEPGCAADTLTTSYSRKLNCVGTGVVSCVQLNALAPGSWRHSLSVLTPDTGQRQHHTSLLITDSVPSRVRFTAFASVSTVTSTADDGDGSLRQALQNTAAAAKPLLIQFDPGVFPADTPTTVIPASSLPTLADNDVTIDGTDDSGAIGNRVIDANGQSIGVLAITGAHNHVLGLRLRNNAGSNNRDVLSIAGAGADGNLIERTIIEQALGADGIGVDQQAGKAFDDSVNVIRECEISGADDKGVKVTKGAYARVERCWVHDNANGGIQATLGGHVQAWHNLVERNRGATAQNGLSANAFEENPDSAAASELQTWGNISRSNGANGIAVRVASTAQLRDDYLAVNGSSGLRVYNDVGESASAAVEGISAVCNEVDGVVVANTSTADLGGGPLGSAGNNAFTQNNLPTGANLRNATNLTVSAINNQWEHCGGGSTCADDLIEAYDLSDHDRTHTLFVPAQAHRAQSPIVTGVAPAKGREGEWLRIFGSGFNAIDGHFAQDRCADVAGRNLCAPIHGNCVQIDGVAAAVEAVTPTMLVVRWPFTCTEPVPLVVRVTHGPSSVAVSDPFTVCTNADP